MPTTDVAATAVPARPHGWDLTAIGTRWRVDTPEPPATEVIDAVGLLVADFDRAYSRFRPDSLVAELATTGGPVAFPDSVVGILDLYERLRAATDGAIDPLIGGSMVRLGDDAEHTLRPHGPPSPAPGPGALHRRGTVLTLRPHAEAPAVLDIGALGKGWLVDEVTGLLADHGITAAVVDASGDLRAHGAPIRVALEHPWDPSRAIGVLTLADGALASSATNRRRWGEGLHHVLDARTGAPVERVTATWAVAETAALADGLATALFHTTPETLSDAGFAFECTRVFTDGTLQYRPGPRPHPATSWEFFR